MGLKEKIQDDIKTAMKAGEALKVGALRMLVSEIKRKEIDRRVVLEEAEIHKTISTLIKQRNDSIDAFQKGNRPDLVEKEKTEIVFLQHYLPAQMSEAEVESIVVAAIAEAQATKPQDIGKVMKIALAKIAGRADGKIVNEIVRKKIGQ